MLIQTYSHEINTIMNKIQSSFNGKIAEIQGIYVDNFENIEKKVVSAFFLSHYHSDHIVGLLSDKLYYDVLEKLQNVYIYMTKLTSLIIKYENNFKGDRLMKYIKVLQEGSTSITLPKNNELPERYIRVTLIPAGHCSGATMFLFRTILNNVLYTGDFRINISDLPKYEAFLNNGNIIHIDKMYVDTTFIGRNFESFPKRSESVENMLYEMKKWLKSDENAFSIWTPARYGYEFVFNKIYEELGLKVYVDKRWDFYKRISNMVPGVTNDSTSRIHLCKNRYESNNHTKCGNKRFKNYLHIYLSALKWERHNINFNSVSYRTPSQLDVCFATHCSRSELLYFIRYLSPNCVEGFPNALDWTGDGGNNIDLKKRKLDNNTLNILFRC